LEAVHHAIPLLLSECYLNQKALLLPGWRFPSDLAAMPSTERASYAVSGIKWRNAHQNKHLTKPEMLAALYSLTMPLRGGIGARSIY